MSEVSDEINRGNLEFKDHVKKRSGFEGITYFEEIDRRYITVDTAQRSIPGAQTVHFDPNSGLLIYLTTVQNGLHLDRPELAFNLRTGEYLGFHDKDKDPKSDDRLQKALSLIDSRYTTWLKKPPGYPETQSLVQTKEKAPKIPVGELTSEVRPGDSVLFYDNLSHLHACQTSAIEPITDIPKVKNGFRILSNGRNPRVDIDTFNFHSTLKGDQEKETVIAGSVLPVDSEFVLYKDRQGLWKITEEDLVQLKKYAEIPYDPSIESPLSREEYVIAAALDGMAFDRWGASIEKIRASNPSRYEGVTKENLQKAVANLIDRFGEQAFINAIKWTAFQHMYRLHTPRHRTKVMLAQNNIFNDNHSDIVGFKKDISQLARQAIRDVHPVAVDMEKDGHGKVGQGVYNAKSIFGDVDLLEILKKDNPVIFNELVQYVGQLSPIDQGDWYGNSIVHPLNAIRDYFPDAYTLIKDNVKGNLPQEDVPGIVFESE